MAAKKKNPLMFVWRRMQRHTIENEILLWANFENIFLALPPGWLLQFNPTLQYTVWCSLN